MTKQELHDKLYAIQDELITQTVFNGLPVATAVRKMREETIRIVRDEAAQREATASDEWETSSEFSNLIELLTI